MKKINVITPRYCSFYIAGSSKVEIPMNSERVGILASHECILVPALYPYDGDTTVMVGSFKEVALLRAADFDGMLATPAFSVLLFDADDDIASLPTQAGKSRIRIWINHPTEPDEVRIAVGD